MSSSSTTSPNLTTTTEPPTQSSEPTTTVGAPVRPVVDGAAQIVVGDRLFVIGGYANRSMSAGAMTYHLRDKRWERLPDLPRPAADLFVVADGDRVVVGGGTQSGVFSWSDGAARWTELPIPPESLERAGNVRSRMVAVGGGLVVWSAATGRAHWLASGANTWQSLELGIGARATRLLAVSASQVVVLSTDEQQDLVGAVVSVGDRIRLERTFAGPGGRRDFTAAQSAVDEDSLIVWASDGSVVRSWRYSLATLRWTALPDTGLAPCEPTATEGLFVAGRVVAIDPCEGGARVFLASENRWAASNRPEGFGYASSDTVGVAGATIVAVVPDATTGAEAVVWEPKPR